MAIPQTLAGMYHTKEPFLEGNAVPVIARKFNWIPTAKGEGDPSYMLSAPYNPFGVKTIFYDQHAVKSDFPKRNAFGGAATLWNDGDYDAVRKGMDMDYAEEQAGLKKAFKPSEIINYLREEADNSLTNAMRDYFVDKAKNDEESKRYFLEQYGLNPEETETLLRQQKVEAAAEALKRQTTNPKLLDPARRKLHIIANQFHRGDTLQVSMNDRSGIGDFDLGVTGLEGRAPRFQAATTAAGRRALQRASVSREQVIQNALSGLPDYTDEVEAITDLASRRAAAKGPEKGAVELALQKVLSEMRGAPVSRSAAKEALKAREKEMGVASPAGRKAGGAAAASPRGAGEK